MILKNCRLIPELSNNLNYNNCNILIKNNKIEKITCEDLVIENENIFDCQGKTLLPGLIDAHTHISGLNGYNPRSTLDPIKLFLNTSKHVQTYLDYGFTTIRDAGVTLRINNYVRDAIEDNLFIGPRIISCGLILTPTEVEFSDSIFEFYTEVDSVDEVRKACRKEFAQHSDFIKIMASGSALHKQGIPKEPIMTDEEIRAAVQIANMKGSYVAAHAHSNGSIRSCIKEGVKTIEHASFIEYDSIELLKNTPNTYLIPTLAAMYQDVESTLGTPYEFLIEKLQNMLNLSSKKLEVAYKEGFKLGFGTDCTAGSYQYENGIEFKYRKKLCHMNNIDILLQATKNNAEILGISNITGEIKEGLSADLILIDGNPDKDISVMYKKPDCVWSRGIKVK